MQQSTLLINGSHLDKQKLLHLIEQNQKLEAIKYIKAATRVDLESCKEIVDNLSEDPNYYDNYDDDIAEATGIIDQRDSGHGKAKKSRRKGGHVIASSQGSSKPLLIAFIAFVMLLVLYFFYF